jgi:translation elongation factor EF-Ts
MSLSIIDVQTYNQGKIGAIVEITVECNECDLNDFEKSNLRALVKDIVFQIAAASPKYLSIEDVPDDIIESIKNKTSEDLRKNYFLSNNRTEKAELHIQRQISKGVESLLSKFYEEECLLSQHWIKDKSKTMQGIVEEKALSIGKTIKIKRFERYEIKKEIFQKQSHAFNISLGRGIPIEVLKDKCPNCGNRLICVANGSSYEILCERQGCCKQTYRGI